MVLEVDSTGRLDGVEQVASPNCDRRPVEAEIRLIVIHGISLPPGEYGGPYIRDFFCNRLDEIVQFVSFDERAWHAGESNWRGEPACNDFSIGIELEGCDEEIYTEAQYQSLAGLIRALRVKYPGIATDAIVGHSDIAPGRKTDPGHSVAKGSSAKTLCKPLDL